MTDTNNKDKKETETEIEMLARLVVNGFAEMKDQMANMDHGLQGQINGLQGQINGLQGKINGLENQFEDLRGEMRAGFEDNRIEHKEMIQHLESLDRKQVGTLESLDETVTRTEHEELKERVVILETKFA
jgi:hypothetical protein